jgi:hypothetical protein
MKLCLYPIGQKRTHLYGLIYGIYQNIGIAIDDYSKLSGTTRSNICIKEVDFRPSHVENQELKVSERTSHNTQIIANHKSKLKQRIVTRIWTMVYIF